MGHTLHFNINVASCLKMMVEFHQHNFWVFLDAPGRIDEFLVSNWKKSMAEILGKIKEWDTHYISILRLNIVVILNLLLKH